MIDRIPARLLLSTLLVLTFCFKSVHSTSQPIYVGAWTNFVFVDGVSKVGIQAVYDGLRAAFKSVNAAGGVHGRSIQMLECEAYINPVYYKSCLELFLNRSAVATIGIYIDRDFNSLAPLLQQHNIMLVAPATTQERRFDRRWMYTRSDQGQMLEAMLRHVAHVLHVRRVGFTYASDLNAGVGMIRATATICAALGLSFVGAFSVNSTNPGYRWRTAEYYAFLAKRPQVIVSFGVSIQSNDEFILDIFNQSMRGDQVDPNLKFITWDGYVASVARTFAKLQAINPNFTADGRVFFTLGMPTMTDTSHAATVHAQRDMYAYWNGTYRFLKNRTDYMSNAMGFWAAAKVVAEVVRKMNPLNLTKDAFIDTVFDMSTFMVDDLLFGIYSGANCSTIPGLCPCNQGHHSAYTYFMNSSFDLVPVPGGVSTTLIGSCGSPNPFVIPPLIYLAYYQAGSSLVASAAQSMLKAATGNDSSIVEFCIANDTTSYHAKLVEAVSDKYFSIVFPAIFTNDQQLANFPVSDGAFVVDPLLFPAQLTPPFQSNVVYLSATLEQEIFTWFSVVAGASLATKPHATSTISTKEVFAVIRSKRQASSILSAVRASAASFNMQLKDFAVSSEELQLPTTFSGFALVIGMNSSTDVDTVVSFLSRNVNSSVFVAFTELSVLYDYFQLTASAVSSRIFFASSQPTWQTNSTSIMQEYFASVPSALRSPLSLRGFFAASSLAVISQQLLPRNLTSPNMANAWFDASVISFDNTIRFGPYSRSVCSDGETDLCEMNVGARSVAVYTLGDAWSPAVVGAEVVSSISFASGKVVYTAPAQSSGSSLTTAQIAGITVSATVGLFALLLLFVMLSRTGRRHNANAPKDPNKPVTVIFTDIQSSTALWATIPQIMVDVLSRHHELIRLLIEKHNCYEVKTIGDAFMIVTSEAKDALALARDLQLKFFEEPWSEDIDRVYKEIEREMRDFEGKSSPTADLPREVYQSSWRGLRVRIGIHTGLADIRLDETTHGYDYYGQVTNIAARTEGHAQGGQILLTADAVAALGVSDSSVKSIGLVALRGVTDPIELFQADAVPGREFAVKADLDAIGDTGEAAGRSSDQHADPSERNPDTESFTGSEERGDLGLRTSTNNKHHYPTYDWVALTAGFLTTLLSTSAKDAQARAVRALCERWRVDTSSAVATSPPVSLSGSIVEADPLVTALARRVAPVMRRKFGTVAASGNFVSHSFSDEQNMSKPVVYASVDLTKSMSHTAAMSPKGEHLRPPLGRSVEYIFFTSAE